LPLPRFFIGGALRRAAAVGPVAVTGFPGVDVRDPLADAVVLRTSRAELVRKPLALVPGLGAGVLVGFWLVILGGDSGVEVGSQT